ncbi:Peptidase family M23 [Streptomyces sp. di188]|nr:Peptidase family M23 [Streptomyces sp. di50b]SCE48132.1 Peptidase family M23 [Streptomyces sp. di188]
MGGVKWRDASGGGGPGRWVRRCVRLVLVVALTVAALLAPPASRLFAAGSAGSPGAVVRAVTGAAEEPRSAADADTVPAVGRTWPVGVRPHVLRGWEPPATVYGPGHRGVDLAAAPGTPVRAVADGRVSFAGRVAGKGAVSVTLTGTGDPPLRTTYEPVRASVPQGAEVSAGEVIGTVEAGGSHCTAPCVHWGLLRGETYLDPLSLLPPWLLHRGPSRLLPVLGVPLP